MKYMDWTIKIYIIFFSFSFMMTCMFAKSTSENRKINLINNLIKSVVSAWLSLNVFVSLFGIKGLLVGAKTKDIISYVNILGSFTENITLISAVLLFVLAVLKLVFSFKEIIETKPDKYIKLYFIYKIGEIFLGTVLLFLLFLAQWDL